MSTPTVRPETIAPESTVPDYGSQKQNDENTTSSSPPSTVVSSGVVADDTAERIPPLVFSRRGTTEKGRPVKQPRLLATRPIKGLFCHPCEENTSVSLSPILTTTTTSKDDTTTNEDPLLSNKRIEDATNKKYRYWSKKVLEEKDAYPRLRRATDGHDDDDNVEQQQRKDNAPRRKEEDDEIGCQCNVCREPFSATRYPLCLEGCGHSFCLECVMRIAESTPRTDERQPALIKCPSCRVVGQKANRNWQLAEALDIRSIDSTMSAVAECMRVLEGINGPRTIGLPSDISHAMYDVVSRASAHQDMGERLLGAFLLERLSLYLQNQSLVQSTATLDFEQSDLESFYERCCPAQMKGTLAKTTFALNPCHYVCFRATQVSKSNNGGSKSDSAGSEDKKTPDGIEWRPMNRSRFYAYPGRRPAMSSSRTYAPCPCGGFGEPLDPSSTSTMGSMCGGTAAGDDADVDGKASPLDAVKSIFRTSDTGFRALICIDRIMEWKPPASSAHPSTQGFSYRPVRLGRRRSISPSARRPTHGDFEQASAATQGRSQVSPRRVMPSRSIPTVSRSLSAAATTCAPATRRVGYVSNAEDREIPTSPTATSIDERVTTETEEIGYDSDELLGGCV